MHEHRRAVKLGLPRRGRLEGYDQTLRNSTRQAMTAAGFSPADEKVLRVKMPSGPIWAIVAELIVDSSLYGG